MTRYCHACGAAENNENARFCGRCGQELVQTGTADETGAVAAPGAGERSAATQHPAPGIPAGRADEPVTLPRFTMPEVDLTRLLAGDWFGAARVAAAAWVTVMLLILALLGLVHPNGVSVKEFLIGVALVLSSSFGGDLVASSSDTFDSDYSYTFSIGAYPLTVTLAALAVGMWLFWRQARRYPTAVGALFHAARSSLVFALLVTIPVVALRGSLEIPPASAAPEVFPGMSGDLGGRAVTAAVLSFLFFGLTAATTVLWRSEWLPPRVLKVRDVLAAPMSGLVAMVLVTPLLGVAVASGLFALAEDPAQNTTTAAVLLAVLPNLGFGGAMLGAGVGVRTSFTDSSDSSANSDEVMHLTGLADQASNWVWLLPVATVLLFATGALVTVLRSATRRQAAQNLLTWVALTAVLLPVLGHFVGVHGHYEGSTAGEGTETGDMFFGLVAWQVFLVSAVAAFVVAVVGSAAVRSGDVAAARQAPAAPPAPPPATPVG